MKILVYGAGVLGSFYAARLQEAGNQVSILARGQRLADLREHGIVLEAINTGLRTITQVNVVASLEPDDAYDLVIVLMRRNQVSAILPVLAANQHTPNILFLGNNAAGPNQLVSALGRERVLMGFGGFGGVRREHVVYYMAREKGDQGQTWIGELDGSHSSRLKRIAQAFEGTGLPVTIERNIDAWLKTHVALISPIAYAIYAADGDNYRLARTRDGLVLLVRAVREGFQVLRALSIPITPAWFKIFEWIPEPLLVTWVRRIMDTQAAEIAMAGHANVARDEMQHLAEEFRTLVRATSVLTPAMDRLHTYFNPDEPSLAEGSAQLPMNWRGVWIGLGLLAGLSLALGVLLRFGKR